MMRNLKLLFSLAFLLFSISAHAGSVTLNQGEWNMLVLPGAPVDRSLNNLFGDELGDDNHCDLAVATATWCVYTYDAVARNYIRPGVNDSLQLGQAFWIIQTLYPSIAINLPDGSPQPIDNNGADCQTVGGCFDIPFPTSNTQAASWSLVGSPYGWSTDVGDIRFQTNTSPCEAGCTLDAAGNTHELTEDFVWIWDPANLANTYEQRFAGDLLSPWQGFWTPTFLAADGLSPVLKMLDTAAFAQVRGFVRETGGIAASGVSVELVDGGWITTTDANGEFTLTLPSNQEHVLKFKYMSS